MNSLDPASSAAALTPVIPTQRLPKIWKFWGTALWGLFIFAAMFVGQIAVVAWFVLGGGGPVVRAGGTHVAGGVAMCGPAWTMGLPAVLAALGIAIRVPRSAR